MSAEKQQKDNGNVRFMQGNEACAEGAVAAGCRFFAGYPISPSSEIAEFMSQRLPRVGGKFIQMEDEIASMGAIIGASLAGAKSMTATSGPGFSLMQENLGFAMMAEVPCVIINVMRGGPSTGNPTGPSQSDVMQAKWGTHGDHPAIALAPGSIREVFDLTIECFNFAELLRTPTVLAIDEITAHMREKIEVPQADEIKLTPRVRPENFDPAQPYYPYETDKDLVPRLMNYGEGARFHVTGLNHDRTGFPTGNPELMESGCRRIVDKVELHKEKITRFENFRTDDGPEVLVVAFGSCARSGKRAVDEARSRGIKAGLFRAITLWPFPEKHLQEAAAKAKRVIVPEMNLGQYIYEVERVLGRGPEIIGVNRVNGEPIAPSLILNSILGHR